MTTLTLNTHTVNIDWNLSSEMAYEGITGESFNPTDIFSEGNTPTIASLANMLAASVLGNTDDLPDDFVKTCILRNPNREEVNAAIEAAIVAMTRYYTTPAAAEAHVDDPEPATEDEERPNA